jgi:hypothetical protein
LAYDAANYEQPAISDLNWTIGKASYDMTGAGWDYPDPFVFDGTEKIVELTGLPDGVTAFYSGNTATAIGNFTASVTLAYDAANYEQPAISDLNWTIGKASFDMTSAGWDYTDPFAVDGSEKIVELTGLPDGVTVAFTVATRQLPSGTILLLSLSAMSQSIMCNQSFQTEG